jgi:hypothetical protein
MVAGLSFAERPAQSVLNPLGAIMVTFIPNGPTSLAKDSLNPSTAYFVAL